MKNINVTQEEKEQAIDYNLKTNAIIDGLERIKNSPALLEDVKKNLDVISEEEQKNIIKNSIRSIEDMSYYLRFEEGDMPMDLFRNLNKVIDKEVKRIKNLDHKAIDKIIDRKHKCVSFLHKKLVDMKIKSFEVNYEYHDKLTGFMTKRGKFKWNDEKIDELFGSLMK